MESLIEERRIRPGLWQELKGMLLISSFSHALILGLLAIALYHYNWARLERDPGNYPVHLVNLVNFSEAPLISYPKPFPNLPGLREVRRENGLHPLLNPNFKATAFRKAKYLAVISEEPVNPPAISNRVAYPTPLKPAKGRKLTQTIITGQILYPPSPKKIIARRAMSGLNPGKEQPIPPSLTPNTSLILRVRIKSLGKETLALGKRHMDVPESLQFKSYQTRGMNKGRHQRLAGLLMAETLSPAQISHPDIPPAPAPNPFTQGRGGSDPFLIKGGGFTSLNTKDPTLLPYISQVRERVLGFWRYPMEANSGIRGTVQLAFTVERDGSVSRIKLLKSSGYPLLDNGAMQALSRASPFSPLPQESKVINLSIAGTFKYNME